MAIRIYLADLAHTHSVQDTSLTVPLSLGYIKAYAVQTFADEVDIRLFKHPEKLLSAVHEAPPDIIGFANYGWNSDLNRCIGTHVRSRFPSILIVAGGPNVDADPVRRAAFLECHSYIDVLVIDGGEQPFADIINWWKNGRNYSDLPQNIVAFDADRRLIQTPMRPLAKIIEGNLDQ